MIIARDKTTENVCPVTNETCSVSPLPLYWAINIDPAIVIPTAKEIKKNKIGKLNDTAATASVPNLPTQNVSVN